MTRYMRRVFSASVNDVLQSYNHGPIREDDTMRAQIYALVTLAIAYYGMCYAAHVSLWAPIANALHALGL